MWGPIVNVLALVYGGCDARELRLATGPPATRAEPDRWARSASVSQWLNKIPILYTVLAFILIIGVLYYVLFEIRKPLPRACAGRVRPVRDPARVTAARGVVRLGRV